MCVVESSCESESASPPQKKNKPTPLQALQRNKRNPGLTLPGRPRIKSRKRKAPASFSRDWGDFSFRQKNHGEKFGTSTGGEWPNFKRLPRSLFEKKQGGVKLTRDKEGCTPNVRVPMV